MNNQNSRFLDGFIMGLIIGGAAVFLLGTEKGKKVLKSLTENGVGGLTELLEAFDETKIKKDLPKPVQKIEEKVEEVASELATNGESNGHSEKPARKFFRRKV